NTRDLARPSRRRKARNRYADRHGNRRRPCRLQRTRRRSSKGPADRSAAADRVRRSLRARTASRRRRRGSLETVYSGRVTELESSVMLRETNQEPPSRGGHGAQQDPLPIAPVISQSYLSLLYRSE